MMDLTKDRGWDSNTITKHEKDMIEVLKKYLTIYIFINQ